MMPASRRTKPQPATVSVEDRVRVKYRVNDAEIEVEGPRSYVDSQIQAFVQQMGMSGKVISTNTFPRLPDPNESDDSIEEAVYSVVSNDANGSSTIGSVSLLDFYQQKAPTSQRDQVLVISYYLMKIQSHESVTLEDYEQAYSVLRKLAVPTPANMKSSVRNVVDRSPYLYNPERGVFTLTVQGEKYVETLPNSDN